MSTLRWLVANSSAFSHRWDKLDEVSESWLFLNREFLLTLLFLFLLLVVPYLILTLVGNWLPSFQIARAKRARVGLSLFFIFTAGGHFLRSEQMATMLPPAVPYRVELIYLTGIFELLGAIGVWIPRVARITGLLLIIMLIVILPANIYSAFQRVEFGGHGAGPLYLLVRLPFQLFVICWTYVATEQKWFQRQAQET